MSDFQNTLNCQYGGVCGGCPWINQPLSLQQQAKLESLKGLDPEPGIQVRTVGLGHLRDRVDMTLVDGKLGLWALAKNEDRSQPQELVDIKECPMMSPELEAWFKQFRSQLPLIKKGSVRLRIGAQGQRGVWLDFSNEDVAHLFEQKDYLKWLSHQGIVEIGQRRKTLYFDENDRPRLEKEPQLHPWFETYDLKGKSYSVYGVVGGFTQSGMKANRVLVSEVLQMVQKSGEPHWVEAFCGSGNFTLPLSTMAESVMAIEVEELSVRALEKGLKTSKIENVKVERVDLKSSKQTGRLVDGLSFSGDYGLVVDPPRSGMMNLLDQISAGHIAPTSIIYVSCFTESFRGDVEKLKTLGYVLSELNLVDQFPHSPHVELVGYLKKL